MKADFYLTQLTMAAYYSLVALGLCLLMGYAGQVSLGQAGFLAIGGYVAALVGFFAIGGYTTAVLSTVGVTTLGMAAWMSVPAAVIVTAAVALVIGVPVLRLRGHYLAMATLAFGFIVSRVIIGLPLLGQADGLSDIPAFRLFAGLVISGKKALRVQNYYIAWALVAVGLLLAINLLASRAGRALRAIHGNEEAAAAMGVNVARYNGGIGPGEAAIMKSVRYLALVAAGGMGSLWGTLAISAALTFLSLRGAFGLYDDAVFGAILVAIMLFAPDGLFGLLKRRRA